MTNNDDDDCIFWFSLFFSEKCVLRILFKLVKRGRRTKQTMEHGTGEKYMCDVISGEKYSCEVMSTRHASVSIILHTFLASLVPAAGTSHKQVGEPREIARTDDHASVVSLSYFALSSLLCSGSVALFTLVGDGL
jgi:hypothetical protein